VAGSGIGECLVEPRQVAITADEASGGSGPLPRRSVDRAAFACHHRDEANPGHARWRCSAAGGVVAEGDAQLADHAR
jgi:hypothetical protein